MTNNFKSTTPSHLWLSVSNRSSLLSFQQKIHMHWHDFEADSNLLAELSVKNLQWAQMNEEAH
jgi:hypothetical protein